jgi:hypothetical protein
VVFFPDKPKGSPITTEPVNNNEEFGVVVRTRLESHSLGKLYALRIFVYIYFQRTLVKYIIRFIINKNMN